MSISIPRDEAARLARWYRGIAADYRAAAQFYPTYAAWHMRAAQSAEEDAERYEQLARVKGAA